MNKKYLSLIILPLLVMGICSCDLITIMDSREDINPTDPNKTSEEDANSYSIEVVSYPSSVEVGKSSPVKVNLLTTTEEEETLIEEGTNSDIILLSSDASILSASKTSVVGVKVGFADLTIRWVSHPSASITIEGIEVVVGYTYDISFAYYITPEEDEQEQDGEDDDEEEDNDESGESEDDDNDEDDDNEEEESGPVEATSITIDIEDSLSLSDFTIKLGTLEDDGTEQTYTQVVFTDDDYQGNDTVKFISTDEEVLKVSDDGATVTALSSGRAYLSVTWVDHDVSSSTIRINVNAAPEPEPEPDPDEGGDGQGGGNEPSDRE